MSIFTYLKRRKDSASVAKERLQIIISHERSQRHPAPTYLPKLQEEILAVVSKYIQNIEKDQVTFRVDRLGNQAILELNVTMSNDHLSQINQ